MKSVGPDCSAPMGRGEYLRHDGPEHVLRFAPTRSGKDVGLVVPTLLTWHGSAIVHDQGRELDAHRGMAFDPTKVQSSAYNPLLEVRRGVGGARRPEHCRTGLALKKWRVFLG
ncbi:MAG: type IV secretory system conjugative DNA transfer family protein [Pseudomonadota bacterium]|nr:type IV secretory system conjugative DNA transfer family protein [Pseudomonadota bacterium]